MEDIKIYNENDNIVVLDPITLQQVNCTVVRVEDDEYYNGLIWYYLRSEYSDDNEQFEPVLGYKIYMLIPMDSTYIVF